jgi:hypothetical protein
LPCALVRRVGRSVRIGGGQFSTLCYGSREGFGSLRRVRRFSLVFFRFQATEKNWGRINPCFNIILSGQVGGVFFPVLPCALVRWVGRSVRIRGGRFSTLCYGSQEGFRDLRRVRPVFIGLFPVPSDIRKYEVESILVLILYIFISYI